MVKSHWSLYYTNNGKNNIKEIKSNLQDSFVALGALAVLISQSSFDILTSEGISEEIVLKNFTKEQGDILETLVILFMNISFGFSIYTVVMSVVLYACMNQLITDSMVNTFFLKHSHQFKTNTTLPFQISIISLMVVVPLRYILIHGLTNQSIIIVVFQIVFFTMLIASVFQRYYAMMSQLEEMHIRNELELLNKEK